MMMSDIELVRIHCQATYRLPKYLEAVSAASVKIPRRAGHRLNRPSGRIVYRVTPGCPVCLKRQEANMTVLSRPAKIRVGDRVGISLSRLRSFGAIGGDLVRARGIVKELLTIGKATIAVVDWGGWQIEAKVHADHLRAR